MWVVYSEHWNSSRETQKKNKGELMFEKKLNEIYLKKIIMLYKRWPYLFLEKFFHFMSI